jgi:phage shock protein A
MFNRLMALIKGWFGIGLDKLENPDMLLDTAKREMEEIHARNRERAVQAITQKNNLQQMVDDLQKKVDTLQAKAELALKRGDRDVALQLLKEKQGYEVSLGSTRQSLEKAVETAEVVKQHIQTEQAEIRKKTAEALALKSQWKSAQIQNEIEKQLSGFREMEDMNSTFARAQEKIRNATSEASARAELGKTSVESKLAKLELAETDIAAENELAQLEAKLGIGSVAPTTTTTTTTTTSDLEQQLAELEAKVGGGGSSS